MSKYPVIVLDGPDAVGKTTLANHLVTKLGAKYLHLTYRWPVKMFDYHSAALFYVLREAEKQPVVLDRWWPSEVAYANVYRDGSKWPLAYRMFEKAALLHNFCYVFCLPINRQEYVRHFNAVKNRRVEMYDDRMEQIWDQFAMIYSVLVKERNSVMTYDFMTQGHDLDKVCQDILEETEDNRCHVWWNRDTTFMNVTGDFRQASYVFVGDELKPKTRREVWPFFEYDNSSLFLAQAFDQLKVPESRLMFLNAKHPDQDRTNALVSNLVDFNLRFVAMGDKARQYLESRGVNARQIKHPQYYRRFARDKIITDLTEVMKWK